MSENITGRVGVDHTSDSDIRLTVWTDPLGGQNVTITVPLGEALDLAANLVNQVTYAARDAMVDVKTGDCPTCRNTRLVDVTLPGNRKSNQRCPACGEAYEAARRDVYARPRIGGGVA